ncbi:MAG: succinylglutamate desuccinylase/aspartoacylase family protein [Candidatus Aminicenantes bacterium]|nr:MAG: succinylglutamate desuccinylase/aspartoacylase family protein [Candidatus Aminicenantes bacterium]
MILKNISLFILLLLFILFNSSPVICQVTIKVGGVTCLSGELRSGFIHVPSGQDGPEIQIPITVVNGKKKGPLLALTAGIHGCEYPPVLALQRLKEQLDPANISGTVILVHIVNIPSFLKRTIYYNPHDWKNQNRAFPGNIDGTMTERIAFQITEQVLRQCDYHLDLHCGDGNEDLMTYLYYTETGNSVLDNKTMALATNFGFKTIIHVTADPKTQKASMCANASLFMGKPAITVECGKLGRADEKDIAAIIGGCLNILKHLKMIDGKPNLLFDPIWVKKTTYIRSEHEGIFYPLSQGGSHVQKGELLGYLTDFFGNIIQKAVAPHDGIIMYIIATPPMSKGEPMVKIGSF